MKKQTTRFILLLAFIALQMKSFSYEVYNFSLMESTPINIEISKKVSSTHMPTTSMIIETQLGDQQNDRISSFSFTNERNRTDAKETLSCDAPTNLVATLSGDNSATLTWDAPVAKSRNNVKTNIILTESFENGIPDTWTQVDADGDGNIWETLDEVQAQDGTSYATSYSWKTGFPGFRPDNWLITPKVSLDNSAVLTYYVRPRNMDDHKEHYGVYYSTTGTNPDDFTLLFEETLTKPESFGHWGEIRTIDLNVIENKENVYIAFRHFNSFFLQEIHLDNVSITLGTTGGDTPIEPAIAKFNVYHNGEEIANNITETTFTTTTLVAGNHCYTVKTACDNNIESDPSNEACVEIIDNSCATPTNLVATLSGDNSATLTWDAPAAKSRNNAKTNIILTESFENGIPDTWTQVDADGDGNIWETLDEVQAQDGISYATSYSWKTGSSGFRPDNWLITPKVSLDNSAVLTYYVRPRHMADHKEHYGVYYSTTGTNPADFTLLFEETLTKPESFGHWGEIRTIDLNVIENKENVYIAFRHFDSFLEMEIHLDNIAISSNATGGDTPIEPAIAKFNVFHNGEKIAENITETTYTATDLIAGNHCYTVKTACDNNIESDPSNEACVIVEEPFICPTPTNLVATLSGDNSTTLTWDAPAAKSRNSAKTNVIFAESFENGIPDTWTQVDADGDGHIWEIGNNVSAQDGSNYATSYSWKAGFAGLHPDNWLITPKVSLGNSAVLTYHVRAKSYADYKEHYGVYYSTTGTNPADFTLLFEETLSQPESYGDWEEVKTINLNDIANKENVYIAFRHFNSFNFMEIHLDNIVISSNAAGGDTPIEPAIAKFNVYHNGEKIAENITETTYTATDLIAGNHCYTVKTACDNNIESDPSNEACVEIIDNSCATPTNLVATLSDDNSATLTWDAPAAKSRNSAKTNVIFAESFENGIPDTWTLVDADGDGHGWSVYKAPPAASDGDYLLTSDSYITGPGALSPDNWLISPKLSLNDASEITYHVRPRSNTYPKEHYGVYYSTTGTNTADFTLLFEETLEALQAFGDWWEKKIDISTIENKENIYIAFRHFDCTDLMALDFDDIIITGNSGGDTPIEPTIAKFNVYNNGEKIAENITETTYTATDLIAGNHCYTVKTACDNNIESDPSNEACVEIIDNSCATPTNLVATLSDDNSATLTWDAPAAKSRNSAKTNVIFAESFENGIPDTWTLVDADGDGHGWSVYKAPPAASDGDYLLTSDSYITGPGALSPDNWLISPKLSLNNASEITYHVRPRSNSYPKEHYGVYYSTTGTNTADFTLLFEETLEALQAFGDWWEKKIDISTIENKENIYIAFRHFDCTDLMALDFDDIIITGNSGGDTPIEPAIAKFNVYHNGEKIAENITETTYTATDLIIGNHCYTVKTACDNNIESDPSNVACVIVEEPFICPTPTNLVATLSGDNSATLTWDAPVAKSRNSAKTNIILTESFENGIPDTWTQIDADGDGHTWDTDNMISAQDGTKYASSISWTSSLGALHPDNWLITPKVSLGSGANLTYYITPRLHNAFKEHYGVYYSTTGTAVEDFTLLFEETLDAPVNFGDWGSMKTINLDEIANKENVYIAFRHFNSTDQSAILLDNIIISSEANGGDTPVEPELAKFNVYHNGNKIAENITETTYTATDLIIGNHCYTVKTACDNNIESNPSNVACIEIIDNSCDAPTDLTASLQDDYIAILTWNAPVSTSRNSANTTVILAESFENGIPDTWTQVDADSDGHIWEIGNNVSAQDGSNYATSYSWKAGFAGLHPDNWLITPKVSLGNSAVLTYHVRAKSYVDYKEHYGVYYSTTGTNPADFTLLFEETLSQPESYGDWEEVKTINLNDIANKENVYIAFRHFNSFNFMEIHLDNITITSDGAGGEIPIEPAIVKFNVYHNGNKIAENITETTFTVNELIIGEHEFNVKTVCNETVESEASNSATVVIDDTTCPPPINVIANKIASNRVELSWESVMTNVDVDTTNTTVILYESFENGIPNSWTLIDADGDGHQWEIKDKPEAHHGEKFISSASWKANVGVLHPNNWIITPKLDLGTSPVLTYYARAKSMLEHQENYGVYYSTTGTEVGDFKLLYQATLPAPAGFGEWGQQMVLPLDSIANKGEVYIAFRHFNTSNKLEMHIDEISITSKGGAIIDQDAYRYNVYSNGKKIAENIAKTTLIIEDLEIGEHCYSIRTVCYDGAESAPSETACVDIEIAPCVIPANLTAQMSGTEDILLTWDVPSVTKRSGGIIFSESFENGIPDTWTQIDADGDGHIWKVNDEFSAQDGKKYLSSASFEVGPGNLTPDNWLITPKITLGENSTLTYYVRPRSLPIHEEHYGVFYSTTGTAVEDFTLLFEETLEEPSSYGNWGEQRAIKLDDITDKENVYIAFRHFDSDSLYEINLDNIIITSAGGNIDPDADIKYNVYLNEEIIAENITSTSYTYKNVTVGTFCFTVTQACSDDIESEHSNKACITIDEPIINSIVTTLDADYIESDKALLHAIITPGNDNIEAKGFDWKRTDGGTYSNTTEVTSFGNNYTTLIRGLFPNTEYTFRSFIVIDGDRKYGDEMRFKTDDVVGIAEADKSVIAYPNPTTDLLTINAIGIKEISIYTISGTVILHKIANGEDTITLSMKNCANGLYLVSVRTADGVKRFNTIKK